MLIQVRSILLDRVQTVRVRVIADAFELKGLQSARKIDNGERCRFQEAIQQGSSGGSVFQVRLTPQERGNLLTKQNRIRG